MDTDVVVIGGGSAGLQAALTLGRMRFDVVVVDAGYPSNAPAHAIGGLLGAHDVAPSTCWPRAASNSPSCRRVRLIEGEATRSRRPTVTLPDDTGSPPARSSSPPGWTTGPRIPGMSGSGERP